MAERILCLRFRIKICNLIFCVFPYVPSKLESGRLLQTFFLAGIQNQPVASFIFSHKVHWTVPSHFVLLKTPCFNIKFWVTHAFLLCLCYRKDAIINVFFADLDGPILSRDKHGDGRVCVREKRRYD